MVSLKQKTAANGQERITNGAASESARKESRRGLGKVVIAEESQSRRESEQMCMEQGRRKMLKGAAGKHIQDLTEQASRFIGDELSDHLWVQE